MFLIVVEALNVMVDKEIGKGRMEGMSISFARRQQTIAQYANNTLFTLLGDKKKVWNLVYMLDTFCLTIGLVLNWSKSSGYWKQWDGNVKSTWIE